MKQKTAKSKTAKIKKIKIKQIYLDNGATTPVDPRVFKAMAPYFEEKFLKFGNPSSVHSLGEEAKKALEKSRNIIASCINAEPSEIVFTSGGTESNNLALKGIAFANKEKGNHIIVSQIEHDCVLESCKWLEKQGFRITYLQVNEDGLISLKELEDEITKDTILVSIMHANNEIGVIEPIEDIAKICKKYEVCFHTDACQSFTKLQIDVKKQGIDLVTINSHKIYGPKGVGALYVRNGIKIEAWQHGGGHESGLRSGTENIPGIVGFAKAGEIACKQMKQDNQRMQKLRGILIYGILKKIPKSALNGSRKKRLPNNVNMRFEFVEGEAILLRLNSKGIACSTGSACSSKSLEPSHVLKAIGLSNEQSHGSLRFTLGRFTTKKDIEYVLKILPGIVKELREMNPLYKEG